MSSESGDGSRRLLKLRPAGQVQIQPRQELQLQLQQRQDLISCSPEETRQLIHASASAPALKNGAGLAGQASWAVGAAAGSPTSVISALSYSSSGKR